MNKQSLSCPAAHQARAASLGSRRNFTAADFLSMHVRAPAAVAWGVIREWDRRRRSRQTLRSLSLREVRDFSLDLTAAEREAGKPFWRA